MFKIAAYDADHFETMELDLNDANFIGEAEFEIQKLVGSRSRTLEACFSISYLYYRVNSMTLRR